MSDALPKAALVTLLTMLERQIADAEALMSELPVGSLDHEAAAQWLVESLEKQERYRRQLQGLKADATNPPMD